MKTMLKMMLTRKIVCVGNHSVCAILTQYLYRYMLQQTFFSLLPDVTVVTV